MHSVFAKKTSQINIVIITGSCCFPGMAALDEAAGRMIAQAALETGVQPKVRLLPVSKAVFGGVPKEVHDKLMGEYQIRN